MKYKLLIGFSLFLASCSQTPVIAQSAWAESVPEVVLQTIAMESANQPVLGQELVAHVIINRAVASHKSLEAICKAPRQFSCWNDRIWAKRWLRVHFDSQTRSRAVSAYNRAINANGAYATVMHYHTKSVHPYWAKGHKPIIIGDHLFYGGIK